MAAINYLFNQPLNNPDLLEFLSSCHRSAQQTSQKRFASLTFVIQPVDLLAVLETVGQQQQHFYFEKISQGTATLAFGVAAQYDRSTQPQGNRFLDAKAFIQQTIQNTDRFGALTAPFAGAHFFCGFSFFEESDQQSQPLTQQPETFPQQPLPEATVFLPAWQISRSQVACTLVANLAIGANFDPEQAVAQIWQMLQRIQVLPDRPVPPQPVSRSQIASLSPAQADRFTTAVTQALQLIESDAAHKIVLAAPLDVESPQPFDLVASLQNLRQRYANCYIFAIGHPQVPTPTTFIGASPERLVSIQQGRLLTDALAGSAPRGTTRAEDARLAAGLLNSSKERHEHQVVVEAIRQHLKTLGVRPQLAPAQLLQLPNIQHLHTPIRATVPPEIHPLDAVAALHPTPAVAGAPRSVACEQIQALESFERSWYAAPIGWVDDQGNGEFAVGIRSALIQGSQARLFAGAGIVKGSSPDRELAEVQLKLQALLQTIV